MSELALNARQINITLHREILARLRPAREKRSFLSGHEKNHLVMPMLIIQRIFVED